MQINQFDENTIKLITEVVLRVLAELQTGQDGIRGGQTPCEGGAREGCPAPDTDAVFIPGKGNGRNLITEREVLQLVGRKQKKLVCPKNTIITALAADRLKAEGITVIRQ